MTCCRYTAEAQPSRRRILPTVIAMGQYISRRLMLTAVAQRLRYVVILTRRDIGSLLEDDDVATGALCCRHLFVDTCQYSAIAYAAMLRVRLCSCWQLI